MKYASRKTALSVESLEGRQLQTSLAAGATVVPISPAPELNPQPLPPGRPPTHGHPMLNPQPLPPRWK